MYYDDDALLRLNTIIISVISSALPVISIVALYYIKTTIQRIGALVAFTVVFAFALATFTNARRLEIFATTSTYVPSACYNAPADFNGRFAAVEVVFIGSALGSPSGNVTGS